MEKILIINPGSTSTKIAVNEDEKQLFVQSIEHSAEEIAKYSEIFDQYEFRRDLILAEIEKHGVKASDLTCVMSRGGLLPPVSAGAIRVNQDVVDQLHYHPQNEHASNLGAAIALSIAEANNIPAYIYDPVTVDEMTELAKVTGMPEMRRKSLGHNLNMRAMAHKYAENAGKKYDEVTVIVAHMGGGITLTLHDKGRIIDMVSDEEGPFSPERAGGLPAFQLVDMAFSGEYDKKSLMKKIKNNSGLVAHLGTKDAREIEKMIDNGDEHAKLIYEAMAYSISKHIAALSVVVNGKVDAIVLTGGIAYSKPFTDWIKERVSFIAPVEVLAGEKEMEALAAGALRVQRGEEEAKTFVKNF
ncbi:MAG: butyrate kinase [Firmicutes bacterium]|nr:butyrate kinase [Bacillota bacterium]